MKNIRKKSVMENRNKGMIGMNSFVKTLVLVVVMGCLGWSLFGNGSGEKQSFVTKGDIEYYKYVVLQNTTNGSKSTLPVMTLDLLGTKEIKLHLNDYKSISYIAIKRNNQYYDIDGGSVGSFEKLYNSTNEKETEYSLVDQSDFDISVQYASIWRGTKADYSYFSPQDMNIISSHGQDSININWADNENVLEIDILLIYNNSSYKRIQFNVIPEFFKGESEILQKINEYQQTKEKTIINKKDLALYLLYRLISDNSFLEDVTFFKDELEILGTSLDRIDEIDIAVNNLQEEAVIPHISHIFSSLKLALRRNFPYNLNEVEDYSNKIYIPNFNYSPRHFSSIYGSRTNPYIKGYLLFLYATSKPLYSTYISEELNTLTPSNLKSNPIYPYNYKQYQRIDFASTSDTNWSDLFVKNALRYLTWGVEYTPYYEQDNSLNEYSPFLPMQRVFAENFDSLNNWLNEETGIRSNNYYPLGQAPLLIDFSIESDDKYAISKLSLITEKENGNYKPLSVIRMDAWTSRNEVWSNGFIPPITFSDNKVSGEYSLLYDGIISEDKTKNVKFDHPVEFDPTPGSEEYVEDLIDIDFNFKSGQRIQAIGFVSQYDKPGDFSGLPKNFKFNYERSIISIQYKNDDNAEMIELVWEPDIKDENNLVTKKGEKQFYELTGFHPSKKEDHQKFRYEYDQFGIEEYSPGYGLYSGKNSNNAEDLVFSYIILKEPINCKQLRILFRRQALDSSLYTIYMSEIMFFENNPMEGYVVKANKDYKTDFVDEYRFVNFLPKEDNYRYAFYNANMNLTGDDLIKIEPDYTGEPYSIRFKNPINIEQFIVWEKIGSTNSARYTNLPLNYIYQEAYYGDSQRATEKQGVYTVINNLDTPFKNENNFAIIGNPLPYAMMGIDSPRTFAYKMNQQFNARKRFQSASDSEENITFTTMAVDYYGSVNYLDNYITESEGYRFVGINIGKYDPMDGIYSNWTLTHPSKEILQDGINIIKPFLPGFYSSNKNKVFTDMKSPFSVDKIAGVDSLGLVSGAISMSQMDNVYNLFNESIGKTLDQYYSFTARPEEGYPAKPGLDEKGKPAFYNGFNSRSSYLEERAYRLTKADLSRSTVIVPDISELMIGDLLVDFNYSGEPHIGIVVGMDWQSRPSFGSDVSDYWDQVIVLSVRKGFKMVTLGRWGNSGTSIYGGFTSTPEAYQIRRLLVKKKTVDDEDLTVGFAPLWEPLNDRVKRLECSLELANDSYTHSGGKNRWIPNTDELLRSIESINLNAYNFNNEPIFADETTGNRLSIKILSPADLHYVVSEGKPETKSNIYANKGTGLEFYALNPGYDESNEENDPDFLLASFYLKSGETASDGDDRYDVIYNSAFFNIDGVTKSGFGLYLNSANQLVFHYNDESKQIDWEITQFGVKAIGKIRPGDDFLLRFGLFNGLVGKPAPKGDFLAVYDKKMLWRANLYIDETVDGGQDWNNEHRWKNNNEWNYIYDGTQTAYDGVESNIQALEKGEGGQTVTFPDWTKYNEGDFLTSGTSSMGITTKGAVAYASGDAEPPFRFVWEIKQQEAVLGNKAISGLTGYNATTAPDDNWHNYIGHPISDILDGKDITKFTYNKDENTIINFTGTTPYRPNLSAIFYYDTKIYNRKNISFTYNEDRGYLAFAAVSQSSGLDCGALIGAAAAYDGHPYNNLILYSQNPMGTNNWDYPEKHPTMAPINLFAPEYSWEIFGHELIKDSKLYKNGELDIPQPVYPGDIIIFLNPFDKYGNPDPDKLYPHSAMVAYVKYDDDGNTCFNDMILIEATSGNNNEYRVMNSLSLYEKIKGVVEFNSTWADRLSFRRLVVK